MRILVVEDDLRSRVALAKGLTESGFVVDTAADGQAGLHLAEDREHDLMVFDVMLPCFDGWELLRRVRMLGRDAPVLFLTARDSVEDRVKGLTLGADDYLVKPFAWTEFLARVRTLLRRGTSRPQPETLRIADLELDQTRMKVRRGGKWLELTAKEFQLLSLLVRREGEVLSRTALAEQVWEMHFSTDSNAVDVSMGRLRRKVDEGFPVRLIHTVRGLGYVLENRDTPKS